MKRFRQTFPCLALLGELLQLIGPSCWGTESLAHPLSTAILKSDVVLVKSLLPQGTPADLQTKKGVTPLMLAARNETSDLVKLFLTQGADPNLLNADGASALIWGGGRFQNRSLVAESGCRPECS
jgi:hypothetical protein